MAGERHGLLIASSEYQNESLRRLSAPPADVEALADVLRRSDVGGFDIKTLVNQPRAIVELAIQEFFLERKREDLVLLYFSGHGLKNTSNNLYFAMTDTRRRYLEATAVSSRFVHEMMQNSSARRQIVLLDCCFSGAFPRGCTFRGIETINSGQYFDVKGAGQAILTASDDMQYAFEEDEIKIQKVTPSIFTEIVVEGISSGEADIDLDGNVTFDDLHAYVLEQLRARNSRQNPQKWYFGLTGDIVLAANPNAHVRALAEDLRARVESQDVRVRLGTVIDLCTLANKSNGRGGLAATKALAALTKDDSRLVSAAATAGLAHLLAQTRENVGQTQATPSGENKNTEVQVPPVAAALLAQTPSNSIGALPAPEIEPLPTQTRDSATQPWIRRIDKLSSLPFIVVAVYHLYADFINHPDGQLFPQSLVSWLSMLAFVGLPSFVAASSFINYPNRRALEVIGSVVSAVLIAHLFDFEWGVLLRTIQIDVQIILLVLGTTIKVLFLAAPDRIDQSLSAKAQAAAELNFLVGP